MKPAMLKILIKKNHKKKRKQKRSPRDSKKNKLAILVSFAGSKMSFSSHLDSKLLTARLLLLNLYLLTQLTFLSLPYRIAKVNYI